MQKPKILIIGNGPSFTKKTLKMNAYGLRTQQFMQGLKDLNPLQIILDQASNYSDNKLPKSKRDTKYVSNFKEVKQLVKDYQPDFVIAVNNYTAYLASKLPGEFYLIADLNGWLPAESQAYCAVKDEDTISLLHLRREKKILKRADYITTVSQAQQQATIGELSLMGRLNSGNLYKKMVGVIENAQITNFDVIYNQEDLGLDLPKNSLKGLWLGAFNNWADELCLFRAIKEVVKKNPNFQLIMAGVQEDVFGNQKYENFLRLIKEAKISANVHNLGYIDYLDLKSLIEFCDLGIVTDLDIYETQMGARNRINEMLKFKTPVVCTYGSQISKVLHKINPNLVAESGDYKSLASMILSLGDKKELAKSRKCVEGFNKTYLDNTNLLEPIRNFIKHPFRNSKARYRLFSFIYSHLKRKVSR